MPATPEASAGRRSVFAPQLHVRSNDGDFVVLAFHSSRFPAKPTCEIAKRVRCLRRHFTESRRARKIFVYPQLVGLFTDTSTVGDRDRISSARFWGSAALYIVERQVQRFANSWHSAPS